MQKCYETYIDRGSHIWSFLDNMFRTFGLYPAYQVPWTRVWWYSTEEKVAIPSSTSTKTLATTRQGSNQGVSGFCRKQHLIINLNTTGIQDELWFGLEALHKLTSERDYQLHVTLKDFDNQTYFAVYSHFKVLLKIMLRTNFSQSSLFHLVQVEPGEDYKLDIAGFDSDLSTLGDAFTVTADENQLNLHGMKFTTKYDINQN